MLDNDPAVTSLIESWSTMRAMRSGSRMIVKNSLVGNSKSNGIVERTVQSVQGIIRTMRSAIEETWEVKIDVTHSVWPWIAEQAGFLLTRFEVGRNGKTAYERLKGKSAPVQGLSLAEGIFRKRRRAGRACGKDGMYLEHQSSHGRSHGGEPEWRVAHKNGPEKGSERNMGTKQPGDDRGGSVAQERRRCKHGR